MDPATCNPPAPACRRVPHSHSLLILNLFVRTISVNGYNDAEGWLGIKKIGYALCLMFVE